jgi:predicted transposase/invertase (TIGR01784 family)
MFQLTPLHKTRAWQKMRDDSLHEGMEKGMEKGMELAQMDVAHKCLKRGMSPKETAELTGLSIAKVRQIAKQDGKKK